MVPWKSFFTRFVFVAGVVVGFLTVDCVSASRMPAKTVQTELGARLFGAEANRRLETPLVAGPAGSPAFNCRVLSSMVMVYASGSSWYVGLGSGVIIGDGRHVLTAFHVITAGSRLAVARLACANGTDRQITVGGLQPATLVAWNRDHDAGILEIPEQPPSLRPLPVTLAMPPLDAPVWHYGITSVVEPGRLEEWASMSIPGEAVVQGTARPGDSGGPVVDAAGQVIGITIARVLDMDQDYYLFVPINDLTAGLLWEPE